MPLPRERLKFLTRVKFRKWNIKIRTNKFEVIRYNLKEYKTVGQQSYTTTVIGIKWYLLLVFWKIKFSLSFWWRLSVFYRLASSRQRLLKVWAVSRIHLLLTVDKNQMNWEKFTNWEMNILFPRSCNSPHLCPSKTGHAPWRVRGSGFPLRFRLNQNAAPPFTGLTATPARGKAVDPPRSTSLSCNRIDHCNKMECFIILPNV